MTNALLERVGKEASVIGNRIWIRTTSGFLSMFVFLPLMCVGAQGASCPIGEIHFSSSDMSLSEK